MGTRARWLGAAVALGDSITEGTQTPGGYRIGLWQRLASGGYTTDFVGSQFNLRRRTGQPAMDGRLGR